MCIILISIFSYLVSVMAPHYNLCLLCEEDQSTRGEVRMKSFCDSLIIILCFEVNICMADTRQSVFKTLYKSLQQRMFITHLPVIICISSGFDGKLVNIIVNLLLMVTTYLQFLWKIQVCKKWQNIWKQTSKFNINIINNINIIRSCRDMRTLSV